MFFQLKTISKLFFNDNHCQWHHFQIQLFNKIILHILINLKLVHKNKQYIEEKII